MCTLCYVNAPINGQHFFCFRFRRSRKADMLNRSQPSVFQKKSQSALRYTNQLQVDRCPECNAALEQYDEDTISMCIVALGTFIHREPSLAAPLLVDMLQSVARSEV